MIDIKYHDLDQIKIDKKSYKNFLIYHIGYAMVKDHSQVKIISVNSLSLIIDEINRHIE